LQTYVNGCHLSSDRHCFLIKNRIGWLLYVVKFLPNFNLALRRYFFIVTLLICCFSGLNYYLQDNIMWLKIWTSEWTQLLQQVPHSQSSLKENPKFLHNFKPKNSTPFWIFSFNIYHCIHGLTFNSKNYYFLSIVCTTQEKNSKTYVWNVSQLCECGTSYLIP
jgi:hypothetical protein